ncbi:hypothetical protein ABPG72_019491 [Tetrahymena utriculariae]
MNRYIIFALIALLAIVSAQDCKVQLPRLLIGDKYTNATSDVTAIIAFDTTDLCKGVATLNFNKGDPSFDFRVIDPVVQAVDTMLDHNGNEKEQVKYLKYTQIIQLKADVQQSYTVQIQGNKADNTTIFGTNYTFILPKLPSDNSKYTENQIKFMFFGDQDLTANGTAVLNYLQNNTKSNKFDAMIYLGDYAYEFYQQNGKKGDNYIEQLAPLSFSYPLAMTPGNHEDNLNFTLFNEKFFLPGFNKTKNNYNSFTIGMVHFVHINLHFFSITTNDEKDKMLKWLKNDLAIASNAGQRKNVPWIIAVGHKLNYCYNPYYVNNTECIGYAQQFLPVDNLLSQFGVDLFIVAHEHYNQVMAPMAHNQLQEYQLKIISSTEFNLKKGKGYVTIVQGNGGCVTPIIPQSKSRMLDLASDLQKANLFIAPFNYGYGYIQVINQTNVEYVSYDAINQKELVKFNIKSTHQSSGSSSTTFGQLITFSLVILSALFTAF